MVEHEAKGVTRTRKCELLSVKRNTTYYKARQNNNNEDETALVNEIIDIYLNFPFYGYRRILVALWERGYDVTENVVRRVMRENGLAALYPKKNTSARNQKHKVWPYLLGGLKIDRPNQVWQVDITYIKIRGGFVYLVCLIDVFSRKIMGSNVSTFLETESCLKALYNALQAGFPEIINSDQGCQFTSNSWVSFLLQENIRISMDGKGRWLDNVFVERFWRTIKYECVYLNGFETVDLVTGALYSFIEYYNHKRPHQALNYHTPNAIEKLGHIPTKEALYENFKLLNDQKKLEVSMI